MLLIDCPYCGKRPEVEFHCGGEAHIARPETPTAVGDADWGSFLYYRTNPKGVQAERWLHGHGCGRWFNALVGIEEVRRVVHAPERGVVVCLALNRA